MLRVEVAVTLRADVGIHDCHAAIEAFASHFGIISCLFARVIVMAVSELFDEWSTYEKVVAGDYMHHRRYFGALVSQLKERPGQERPGQERPGDPIHVLDLGCGDGVPVVPLLESLPVASYLGVDPSDAALEHAQRNLSHLRCPLDFLACTMEEALGGLEGPFDLILASYALHHLSTASKLEMLAACRQRLAPGGCLAVIDVFRDGDESRAEWLDRWEADARARFRALDAAEIERLVTHVRVNDFPETFDEFRTMGKQAGYGRIDPMAVGPERVNGAVILRQ